MHAMMQAIEDRHADRVKAARTRPSSPQATPPRPFAHRSAPSRH
ncbi:hypothetical protein [Ancylobacter mangrovi]|nr:hypothetical protein [Ancylobacter mangrovi]MCS0502908.1 hypothetical protein [Ancylobacter mangrovi]